MLDSFDSLMISMINALKHLLVKGSQSSEAKGACLLGMDEVLPAERGVAGSGPAGVNCIGKPAKKKPC